MANFKDLTGEKFGRLTVKGLKEKRLSGKRYRYYWDCECDCGNTIAVRTDCLTSGDVKSCGCLKREQDKINLTTHYRHLKSRSNLWNVFHGIRARCYNPKEDCYPRYGGRGIKVCDEWMGKIDPFIEWAYAHGYEEGKDLQIDRIDNNGDYTPDNCRWVTRKENCRNRRSNRMVKDENGEYITIVELSERLGEPYRTVYDRYYKQSVRRSELENTPTPC